MARKVREEKVDDKNEADIHFRGLLGLLTTRRETDVEK